MTSAPSWSWRLAGGLLVVLGLANAAFGLLSLATDLVRLTAGTAGGLLAVGIVTAAVGVLVWRGSRQALTLALVLFGALLVLQVAHAFEAGSDHGGAEPRVIVLAVLVAVLAFARFRLHGTRRR